MEDPFLRSDEGLDLLVGIECDPEPPLVERRDRRPELRHPRIRRVTMGSGIAGRLGKGLDDMRRCRQIGIADAEADDVCAARPRLRDLPIDLREQVRGEFLDPFRSPHA
jgi:hypothetical protein